MLDRAMATVIATAAACAAAVMAVFALGFALYALIVPSLGAAGASAVVALVAALGVALFALIAVMRARARDREAAAVQAEVMDELPALSFAADFARERPLVTLAVSALGGILAARHPHLARDVIGLVARFNAGRR